jgi:hypothetical protein
MNTTNSRVTIAIAAYVLPCSLRFANLDVRQFTALSSRNVYSLQQYDASTAQTIEVSASETGSPWGTQEAGTIAATPGSPTRENRSERHGTVHLRDSVVATTGSHSGPTRHYVRPRGDRHFEPACHWQAQAAEGPLPCGHGAKGSWLGRPASSITQFAVHLSSRPNVAGSREQPIREPGSLTMTEQTNRALAHDPQDLERLLVSRQHAGDVDGMAALYEREALLDSGGAQLIYGREAIRRLFAKLGGTGRKFQMGEQRPAMVCGDLALTSTRLPDGTVTAEVARRQNDGTWLWVIDQFSIATEP